MRQTASYVSDLWSVLREARHQAYAINWMYVVWGWLTGIFSAIFSIIPFVIAMLGFGYLAQVGHLGKDLNENLVVIAVFGYCAYLATDHIIRALVDEMHSVFRSTLTHSLECKQKDHVATLDRGRLLDPKFIELSKMVESRGLSSIGSLWNAQKDLLASAIGFAISMVILLATNWMIGALAFLVAMPSIVKRWIAEQRRRQLDEAETSTRRKRDEAYGAISSPKMAPLTRALNLVEPMVKLFRTLSEVLIFHVRMLARFERKWDVLVSLIAIGFLALLGWYFVDQILSGQLGFVQMAIVVASARLAIRTVSEFGWSIGSIGHLRRDYQYWSDFFNTKPLVDESHCRDVIFHNTPRLLLNDVKFSYPEQQGLVLQGCSFSISQGEKMALVGRNGCGKTTLLELLCRTYVPVEGAMLADYHPLDTITQKSWMRHVVMAPQGALLPGMEISRAMTGDVLADAGPRLQRALELANAQSIVGSLPLGLKTFIGQEWPDGKGFSAGERQRLLLAAVFYRLLDPEVFIGLFDEPTANCDAETKAIFYQALAKAPEFAEKTIVVSLHDPLYLRFFDRVIHLDHGVVANEMRGEEEIVDYQKEIAWSLAGDL